MLSDPDRDLIRQAEEVIGRNFDHDKRFHVVGAALRCKSGAVYLGINCDNIHGSCAEFVAMGAARAAGERDFDAIVAVHGDGEAEPFRVVPPCGNCRQMLFEYAPQIDVILRADGEERRVPIRELLPYPYTDAQY